MSQMIHFKAIKVFCGSEPQDGIKYQQKMRLKYEDCVCRAIMCIIYGNIILKTRGVLGSETFRIKDLHGSQYGKYTHIWEQRRMEFQDWRLQIKSLSVIAKGAGFEFCQDPYVNMIKGKHTWKIAVASKKRKKRLKN